MKYNQPFGVVDPNAPYINGNPATDTEGSIPPAAQMEFPQREIVYCITASGQTPTNADLTQLWKSMQRAITQRFMENPTLYVSPNGDDNTSDGTTPETAFATPRQAILVGRQRYPLTATLLTIDIADGTYPALGSIPTIAGTLILLGNEANPGAVLLSGTAPSGRGVNGFEGGSIDARGITFQSTSSGAHTIAAGDSRASFQNCRFVTTQGDAGSHIYANPNCTISMRFGCSSQGGAGRLFWANGGAIHIGSISSAVPFTIVGPATFSDATALASENGVIRLYAGATFPGGTVTGIRYRVEDNATIKAFGNGEEAFPGTQAGVKTDNGVYKP